MPRRRSPGSPRRPSASGSGYCEKTAAGPAKASNQANRKTPKGELKVAPRFFIPSSSDGEKDAAENLTRIRHVSPGGPGTGSGPGCAGGVFVVNQPNAAAARAQHGCHPQAGAKIDLGQYSRQQQPGHLADAIKGLQPADAFIPFRLRVRLHHK